MARWLQTILLAVNLPLFVAFAVRAWSLAQREQSPRFRSLLRSAAGLAIISIAGGLLHLGSLAIDAEVVSESAGDAALVPIQAGAAALAIVLGIAAWRAFGRARDPLVRAEQILVANAITPLSVSVAELGLTARELEVLEAMLQGHLSDREISAALFVSPSTAGSAVSSIMKKAGAGSRRELLTLLPADGTGADR